MMIPIFHSRPAAFSSFVVYADAGEVFSGIMHPPVGIPVVSRGTRMPPVAMAKSAIGKTLQSVRRMARNLLKDSDQRSDSRTPRRGPGMIVALIVSFLLWFTVSMRGTYPLTVNLPTEVVNLSGDQSLEALPPSSVRVQVQGEGWQLLRLYSNRHLIPIEAVEGQTNLMERVTMSLPRELQVQTVDPEQCTVQIGSREWTRLPIAFRGRVEPAVTHDLTEPLRLEPDSVTVSGARRVLNRLTSWPTEYVVATNVRGPITRTVALLDTLGGLVDVDRETTTLYAELEQFTEVVREVDVRIVDRPADNQGVSLNPSRVTMIIQVPLSKVEEVNRSEEFYATVSYEEIASDTLGAVEPQLHVPEIYANRTVRITPSRLQYYVVVN